MSDRSNHRGGDITVPQAGDACKAVLDLDQVAHALLWAMLASKVPCAIGVLGFLCISIRVDDDIHYGSHRLAGVLELAGDKLLAVRALCGEGLNSSKNLHEDSKYSWILTGLLAADANATEINSNKTCDDISGVFFEFFWGGRSGLLRHQS